MRFITLLSNLAAVVALFAAGGLLFYYLVLPPDFFRFNPTLLSHPIEWLVSDDNSPLNQRRIIQTVQLWARLDPLPQSAHHLRIDGTGHLFDKTYIITFDARPQEVIDWLASSPGTAQVSPIGLRSDGGQSTLMGYRYPIQPRDAAFAEVTITPNRSAVRIKAFWK